MILEFSGKSFAGTWLACVIYTCSVILILTSGLEAQNTQPVKQIGPHASQKSSPVTSADWVTRDFWKSDKKLWQSSNGWVFEDGEIRLARPELSGHLYSPPLPPNFDLSWKWKIAEGTNSGLKYRVRRSSNSLYKINCWASSIRSLTMRRNLTAKKHPQPLSAKLFRQPLESKPLLRSTAWSPPRPTSR